MGAGIGRRKEGSHRCDGCPGQQQAAGDPRSGAENPQGNGLGCWTDQRGSHPKTPCKKAGGARCVLNARRHVVRNLRDRPARATKASGPLNGHGGVQGFPQKRHFLHKTSREEGLCSRQASRKEAQARVLRARGKPRRPRSESQTAPAAVIPARNSAGPGGLLSG